MLIRKPTVIKPPTTAAGRVAQAISRMAALWRNRSCHQRPFLVGDIILTDPPHHENSLVGLRLRSAGIALPPRRSQIRDNHLQLVPRRSGDGRRRRKPERLALFLLELWRVLPTDRHRAVGIAVRRLFGWERLSGARRVVLVLFSAPVPIAADPAGEVCAAHHDFEDYRKVILSGPEHLTRPSSPGSPAKKHHRCIGPYGSLRCPASVADRSRERPDFVPLHRGVSRKSSSRSQVLASAWRYDAAKTGYQSHSADGRPKRATVAAIPMDGGAPR